MKIIRNIAQKIEKFRQLPIEDKVFYIFMILLISFGIFGASMGQKQYSECLNSICPAGTEPAMPKHSGCICVKYAVRR